MKFPVSKSVNSTMTDFQRSILGAREKLNRSVSKSSGKSQRLLTREEQLASTIKSIRVLLSPVPGLSNDTELLPQLFWLLLLKSLDDAEYAQEIIQGETYIPVIEPPFRWRDWASTEDLSQQTTGGELLKFIDDQLFPYLSQLTGSSEHDIRTIIGAIFERTHNRILDGYILREVVNKLNWVNFNSLEDIRAISYRYEKLLTEMRDAAKKDGKFYTPRPLVRFIINRLSPILGEHIIDPACGTAGFLVEAYEQLKSKVRTPEQQRMLQGALVGIEKNPTPYLLAIMNMWLHGIYSPYVTQRNALSTNIRHITNDGRFDIVVTNPPFDGEEERSILNNFPDGLRTTETTLLFFQYVMALLKRPSGRCGIVVPNGFLFGNGVATIVKKQLLTRFNLHTVIRLPNGVFAPYTSIPTNLLFFEACMSNPLESEATCTQEVWYYELQPPDGRNGYSKTKPLQDDDFTDCIAWWDNRVESAHAWKISAEQLLANGCNLDVKNPNRQREFEHQPPEFLVENIIQKEEQVLEIVKEIRQMLVRRER